MNRSMKDKLRAVMQEATRLTGSGDLQGATVVIQQALGSGSSLVGVDAERAAPPDGRDGAVTHSTFSSNGIELEYRLFTPPGITGPAPLLVMLHGCTQNADDFAIGTGMDALAAAAGLHVLYPSQSMQRNARKCWNWFEPAHQKRGSGELAALHSLSAMITTQQSTDPDRVFIAGMSAGGAMALLLAEQYPELITAVGIHSGLPSGVATSVPQALAAMQGNRAPPARNKSAAMAAPAIIFHGDDDQTVHPCNAAHIVAAQTAHIDTTMITSQGNQAGRAFQRCEYRSSDNHLVCEHWQLSGTAHRWSGGNPAGTHTDAAGPSASAEMIRFFLQIARAAESTTV